MGQFRTMILLGILVVVIGLGLVARDAWKSESVVLEVPPGLSYEPLSSTNPLSTLVNEHRLADAAVAQAAQDAPDARQRRAALLRRFEQNRRFAARALALAESFPDSPQVFSALGWVLVHALDSPQGEQALEWLLNEAIASNVMTQICLQVADSGTNSPRAEQLYQAVWESSPHPDARATAGLLLARQLRRASEQADGTLADANKRSALKCEAESLLEELLAEHGSLRFGHSTVAEAAAAELEELRFLSVGDPAPEIEGDDLEGRPMKLSDFRGRVVVLNFWGHWCTLCQRMYPFERELVERLQGQPFVLLGVNTDNNTATGRTVSEKEGLNMRSWSDGGEVHGGRLVQQWNVQALPTTYILDAQGIIRHKIGPRADGHDFTRYVLDDEGQARDKWELRASEISEVVDHLLQELHEEGSPQPASLEH